MDKRSKLRQFRVNKVREVLAQIKREKRTLDAQEFILEIMRTFFVSERIAREYLSTADIEGYLIEKSKQQKLEWN